MKISELNPYLSLISNINANSLVFLDLPAPLKRGQIGEMLNRTFFDLDDWCFDITAEVYETSSLGIFLFDFKRLRPSAVGVLRMASTTPVPSYVVHSIWEKIAPGMETSVISAEPMQSLSDDLVFSMIQPYRFDGIHICNQEVADF